MTFGGSVRVPGLRRALITPFVFIGRALVGTQQKPVQKGMHAETISIESGIFSTIDPEASFGEGMHVFLSRNPYWF